MMNESEITALCVMSAKEYIGRFHSGLWEIQDSFTETGVIYVIAEEAHQATWAPLNNLPSELKDIILSKNLDPVTDMLVIVDYGDSIYIGKVSRALPKHVLQRYGISNINECSNF